MVLAIVWLGLFSQINQIQLGIGSVSTVIGGELTVPLTCSSLSGNGVISYELDVSFDSSKLDFLQAEKTGTLSANGLISVNEVNGILHIGAIFTNPLYGQGTLLGLKFTAIFPGSAALSYNSAVMNTTTLSNLSGGIVFIDNQPINAGISVSSGLAQVGTDAVLSVSTSGVALMNCTSFQFKLSFDPAVISILDVQNAGCTSAGWDISHRISQGVLSLAGIGTDALMADGILLQISVRVLPNATSFSSLALSDVLFNTFSPTSVNGGRLDIYNLWGLAIPAEADLLNIQNNSPLCVWNALFSGNGNFQCQFQAGTDADWSVAELHDSGWQEGYTQQQLTNLVPGSDLYIRVRLKIGLLVTDWQSLYGHLVPRPGVAILVLPAEASINASILPKLQWSVGLGDPPTGYKLFLGTNNPPGNLVNALDLGLVNSWQATSNLEYNTLYYWQIVPYNSFGDATNCPVWSFRTHDSSAIVQFPYLKDYTDGSLTSVGWSSSYTGNVGGIWRINATFGVGGGKCATAGRSPGTFWYFSPAILCPAAGGQVSFAIRDYSAAGSYDIAGESTDVLVSTTGLTTTDFTQTLLSLDNLAVSTTYSTKTIDLNQFAGQAIYIAFRRIANNGNFIFVDNIQLTAFSPVLSASTSKLVFPATGLGNSAVASFTISNGGTGILSGSISYPAGFSGLSSFNGNSSSLNVTFNPTLAGAFNTALQINSNGGNLSLSLEANAGELVYNCESPGGSGFLLLPSDSAWQLSGSQKHCGSSAWLSTTAQASLQSPWMQGGEGKGLGFWARAQTAANLQIYLNSSGYAEPTGFELLATHNLGSTWTYYRIPFSAFPGQSMAVKLVADAGVYVDDLDYGFSLIPDAPDLLCELEGGNPVLNWLPGFNCQSYKVFGSSDLVSWQLLSPLGFTGLTWQNPLPSDRQFFKVTGVNGE